MPIKPWYQSETIWSDIVTMSIAIVSVFAMMGWITADMATKISGAIAILAGAAGIHGRVTSTTTIGSQETPKQGV